MNRASLLALAIVCAAGCGLMTPDRLDQERRSDRYTGFVEESGIEVCFGDRRIVSPALAKDGPLAICLSGDASARACASDDACGAGERCVCGRCTTRPCRTSTECGNKQVCQSNRCTASCGDERGCGAGEVCSSGGCARPCAGDQDCAFGERCSAFDGTCAVKLCGPAITCGGGDTCVDLQRVADIREPHIATVDGQTVAFVELRETGPEHDCAVYRARVARPTRWVVEPLAPVLSPAAEDGGCLGSPSLLADGSGWSLVASRGDGSAVVRARSTDGVSFTRDASPVLEPAESWENGWVGAPALARWRGNHVMVYEGGHGAGIGLATLGAAGSAVRLSSDPWLTPTHFEDPVLWRGIERIGSPFAVERDGALLVYLTVRGTEGSDATTASGEAYPADPNDSVGLAATRDGFEVERFAAGPVFARRTNLRAYLGEAEPALLFDDAGASLVFSASDATGQQRTGLGLATSTR